MDRLAAYGYAQEGRASFPYALSCNMDTPPFVGAWPRTVDAAVTRARVRDPRLAEFLLRLGPVEALRQSGWGDAEPGQPRGTGAPLPIGAAVAMVAVLRLNEGGNVLVLGASPPLAATICTAVASHGYVVDDETALAALLNDMPDTPVFARVSDPHDGWAEKAPFDAILNLRVTCPRRPAMRVGGFSTRLHEPDGLRCSVHERVGLLVGCEKGRRQTQHIAQRPTRRCNKAKAEQPLHGGDAGSCPRFSSVLIYKGYSKHEPLAANGADMRHTLQGGGQIRRQTCAQRRRAFHQPFALDHLDRGQRHRATQRIPKERGRVNRLAL